MNAHGTSRSDWKLASCVLPLVALLAVLPLVRYGCSCGHDYDFHIVSWMEAATQFLHGNLHPQWAFTPAYNAGEPRFVFYPPLSWTIGAILGLIVPWSMTPIAYTWLALTAAGIGCYRLLRDFAPVNTALLIAAIYAVNPYMLFTAYERTAYAELLAAAWLPLLLHAILRRKVAVPGIALPIALLWLTNAPAAVIGCYGLAILAAVRMLAMLRTGDRPAAFVLLRNTSAGAVLGLGLAAFYVLPAAYERRYVHITMAITNSGMAIVDNFLFHHTTDPGHDGVLRTASLLAVGLLLATAFTLLLTFLRRKRENEDLSTLSALVAITAIIAFLLTPLSAPLWQIAPELPFLQFPWRFLALLTPVLALALALLLRGLRLTRVQALIASLVLVVALIASGYHAFRQICYPEDTVIARVAVYHSPLGTDPTDEYTPRTADNDVLSQSNPPYWVADTPNAKPPANSTAAPLHWPFDLTSAAPQTLILNLRDYPAWHITLNQQLVTKRLPRVDGLIAIPIPAGRAHIEITYARSFDQTAGWAISAFSLAGLALLVRRRRVC
jgi:uncharacterized membrane protein